MEIATIPAPLTPINTQPLDQNPAAIYLSSLARKSRRVQQSALQAIAEFFGEDCDALTFPWYALRRQHCSAIRTALIDKEYAPSTARRYISALKGVLREAWRLELIPDEDYHRAIDIKPIKGQRLPAGRSLSEHEIKQLLESCQQDPSVLGIRDAAILGILRSGLRRSEVVALDVNDINPSNGGLRVRQGKGSKDRNVYFSPKSLQLVSAWLEVRGWEDGPLLLPVNKKGEIQTNRLCDQSVYDI